MEGGIWLCLIFLAMDDELSAVPAQSLATAQMVQSMLLWSDDAFRDQSPIATVSDTGHAQFSSFEHRHDPASGLQLLQKIVGNSLDTAQS